MNIDKWQEFKQGIEEFNTQEYYTCHETLERIWLELEGPEKKYLQGIIQLAVACYHWSRGNYKGALSLMSAAYEKLNTYAQGWIDETLFLPQVLACLSVLQGWQAKQAKDEPIETRYQTLKIRLTQ